MPMDDGTPLLVKLLKQREAEQRSASSSKQELGAWLSSKLSTTPQHVNVLSLIPNGSSIALEAPELKGLTYDELKDAIARPNLREVLGLKRGDRMGICVQNGSQLAVTLLATIQAGLCACPLDPAAAEEEIATTLSQLKARALLTDSPSSTGRSAATSLGLSCGLLVPEQGTAGRFSVLSLEAGISDSRSENSENSHEVAAGTGEMPERSSSGGLSGNTGDSSPDRLEATVLVLPTSGTTGKKKSVPYSLLSLATAAACIIQSWDLKAEDACLCMMPLTHIGGIARNLFSVLLSGGRLAVYRSFDPTLFWEAVENNGITWYYASPTMHRSILEEGKTRPEKRTQIRMVCNAAGGLPPSLAKGMRERFGCSILPSYGMTECMPISSPPTDFDELAPTTSGIPCGPQVAIMNDAGHFLPANQVGNIAVKGPPCFPGYEQAEANKDCWRNGWFLTGDLGMLEDRGWLTVTGRTKEVIKRGGETLAPAEVEETVMKYLNKEFLEIAAFAIKDEELGENVALAAVARPGRTRMGLQRLHTTLRSVLRPQLWPQMLVYCDPAQGGLPKTSTGKLRRAVIAQACASVTITQQIPWRDRYFQLMPSEAGAASPYQVLRPVEPTGPTLSPAEAAMQELFQKTKRNKLNDGRLNVIYSLGGQASIQQISEVLEKVDDFHKPDAVVQLQGTDFPMALPPPKPHEFLFVKDGYQAPTTEEEKAICNVWASVLQCDEATISTNTDFFEAGGTSLQAGRVATELRQKHGRTIATHMIFSHPKLKDLALVLERSAEQNSRADTTPSDASLASDDVNRPFLKDSDRQMATLAQANRPSSTNMLVLLLQLLMPITVRATKQVFLFACFAYGFRFCTRNLAMLDSEDIEVKGAAAAFMTDQLLAFKVYAHLAYFTGIFCAWIAGAIILPCIAILAKWLLVGRMQTGSYPIWGSYYMRWWIARKFMDCFGYGIWNSNAMFRRIHLRLLGGRVAGSAKFKFIGTHFLEADLVDIGENALIDGAKLKCVSLDAISGHILMEPVRIGQNVSIGYKTVIAPGTTVPDDTSLGALSSTHELQDSDENSRRFNRLLRPEPHLLLRFFIGYPLKLICWIAQLFPYLFLLQHAITSDAWVQAEHEWVFKAVAAMTEPHRILIWIAAQAARDCSCVLYMGMVVLMKWLVVGRFRAGSFTGSQWERFQYWFMDLLLGGKQLSSFAKLVGPHYTVMTTYYRLMGATVGQRIFWPGKPIDLIEYDLLEVGNDVTFGSRSSVFCSDLMGAKKVRIMSGAMVADNCCILPGSVLSEGAMLGSGSVGNALYSKDCLAVGNIRGSAMVLRSGDSSATGSAASRKDQTNEGTKMRPFGRVFYSSSGGCCAGQSSTPYTVLSWQVILAINVFAHIAWSPILTSHRWLALVLVRDSFSEVEELGFIHQKLWLVLLVACMSVHFMTLPLSVLIDTILKWVLVGQRRPGVFTWETSSYCQCWKMYSALKGVVHANQSLVPWGGSWWMVLYYRMLGAKIGTNVCLYPWGSSPMMTEPDLVTIGDGACIEAAHIVAHTNVMGVFRLDKLEIGSYCTMRDNSRLISGGVLMDYSTLLEHSLVMPGDVVAEGARWQGWPNRWQGTNSMHDADGAGFV